MYSIFVCAASGILVGLFLSKRDRDRGFGLGVGFALGFGGFMGAVVGVVIGFVITANMPRIEVASAPSTMVSMRTADGVAGTFVWGTGSIHGESSYNFMITQKDGSITPRSVPANSAVAIIEDASLKGVGYWSTTRSKLDPNSALYNWAIPHRTSTVVVREEFRVPVGTVVQTFKMQ